jgi:hypothetical protein
MDKFKINASGEVSIYRINSKGRALLLTSNNAVLPLIKNAVSWLMSNSSVGKIDQIAVYNLGLLLASALVTTTVHSDINQVRYEVTFSETSFSGDFDELALQCTNLANGPVAEVTDISVSKLITEQLLITWTITIL